MLLKSLYYASVSSASKLRRIVLPSNAAQIDDEAFYDSASLTAAYIPDSVVAMGERAFMGCFNLEKVVIGNGLTEIKWAAFANCANLGNVVVGHRVARIENVVFMGNLKLEKLYFLGNAPVSDAQPVAGLSAKACYLPGTTGWGTTFAGIPTILVSQPVQLFPGIQDDQFQFFNYWTIGSQIVISASTEAANPDWEPLKTVMLGADSGFFSDPDWTTYSFRRYRVESP